MISILSTKHTFLAVLFLALFAIAARSVIDPEVRWRFKIAEYIAKHKVSLTPTCSLRAGPPGPADCRSALVTLSMQLITAFSILQGIMVYILGNPPLDDASTGSGSPEAIACVRLQYPVSTLSSLLRRQSYAPSLQTLA
jgi:hypothetical protein